MEINSSYFARVDVQQLAVSEWWRILAPASFEGLVKKQIALMQQGRASDVVKVCLRSAEWIEPAEIPDGQYFVIAFDDVVEAAIRLKRRSIDVRVIDVRSEYEALLHYMGSLESSTLTHYERAMLCSNLYRACPDEAKVAETLGVTQRVVRASLRACREIWPDVMTMWRDGKRPATGRNIYRLIGIADRARRREVWIQMLDAEAIDAAKRREEALFGPEDDDEDDVTRSSESATRIDLRTLYSRLLFHELQRVVDDGERPDGVMTEGERRAVAEALMNIIEGADADRPRGHRGAERRELLAKVRERYLPSRARRGDDTGTYRSAR